MEQKILTCIGCPMGCRITVTLENGAVSSVSGNTCKRGDRYARQEVTHPTRIVTTTVRVSGGSAPVVSVKTASAVPKEQMFPVMDALNRVTVPAPVAIGDVILADAAGTGVPVVATRRVAAAP